LGCVVVLVVLLFVAVFAALAVGGSYNRLVRLQQTVDQSWAQVQNVYQRRADLIPNLVNTVSGAANFEKSTLVEVTNARASVVAGKLGFAPKALLTAQPRGERPPPVQFDYGAPAQPATASPELRCRSLVDRLLRRRCQNNRGEAA